MFGFPFKKPVSDQVTDISPKVPSSNEIQKVSNIAGLPTYSKILDRRTDPAVWLNLSEDFECVLLMHDDRRVHIVTSEVSASKSKQLGVLSANLVKHAYAVDKTIIASSELLKRLRGANVASQHSAKIQQMKSEPLIRFKSWLEKSIDMGASDIHLETNGSSGQIRVRAHGEMWPLEDAVGGKYPAEQIAETIGSAFQNMTQTSSNSASIWKPDTDSYTMLNYDLGGHLVKMRFQSIAGNQGPKAVLRIFNDSDVPSKTLKDLTYPDCHLAEFRRSQSSSSGLVLFAGITGSGKTTTIRSYLETHPDNGSIVINTVEDPVELPIKNAHQKSIQRSFDDTEEEAKKKYIGSVNAMLRGDIDIGALGELRDSISANAWLNLAETGHMGVATLHAHRLLGCIPRLVNDTMGLSRDVLTTPQTINLFVYQALIPANCPVCALSTDDILKHETADIATIRDAIEATDAVDLDATYFKWRNPTGCSVCRGRGTQGQTLLAELLTPDYEWLDLIRLGLDAKAADYHRSRGVFDLKSKDLYCRSIVEHGLLNVLDGNIDLRTLGRFEKLADFSSNYLRLKKGIRL